MVLDLCFKLQAHKPKKGCFCMAVVFNVTFRDGIGNFWKHILPSRPKGVAVSFIWGVGDLKMTKCSESHHELSFVWGQICCKKNHIPCGLETPWKATYLMGRKQAAFRVSKNLSLIFIVCKLHLFCTFIWKKVGIHFRLKRRTKRSLVSNHFFKMFALITWSSST